MGPDFSIHGFDNGAGGAFENGAGSLHCPKIPVFVVFRRSLARTSYQTSFAEISFLGLRAFPDTEFFSKKKRGKSGVQTSLIVSSFSVLSSIFGALPRIPR